VLRIGALLSSFDRYLDKSFPVIDENAQDPTYFKAAYFDIRNIVEARWIYKIVRSLTKYITSQIDSIKLGTVDTFWNFDRIIKRRILKNYSFSYAEK
jgi:hypothetical protein